jgi:hypothetical protein
VLCLREFLAQELRPSRTKFLEHLAVPLCLYLITQAQDGRDVLAFRHNDEKVVIVAPLDRTVL